MLPSSNIRTEDSKKKALKLICYPFLNLWQ